VTCSENASTAAGEHEPYVRNVVTEITRTGRKSNEDNITDSLFVILNDPALP